MDQNSFNLISAITTSITAVFAFVFGIWQIKINERLKKLQDFVAISISPEIKPLGIRVMNVGKINLYLRKAEIGHISHDYEKPRLVSVGTNPHYFIAISMQDIPILMNKEISTKLYFIDETGQKYLALGQAIIEANANIQSSMQAPDFQQSGQSVPTAMTTTQINVTNMRAWSYKMERYNWKL